MAQPLTADEIIPLVERLTPEERLRLFRLLAASPDKDAAIYRAAPIADDEFSSDDDALSWDADGWENIE